MDFLLVLQTHPLLVKLAYSQLECKINPIWHDELYSFIILHITWGFQFSLIKNSIFLLFLLFIKFIFVHKLIITIIVFLGGVFQHINLTIIYSILIRMWHPIEEMLYFFLLILDIVYIPKQLYEHVIICFHSDLWHGIPWLFHHSIFQKGISPWRNFQTYSKLVYSFKLPWHSCDIPTICYSFLVGLDTYCFMFAD